MLCLGKTDIGKRRSVNQDSFICREFEKNTMLAVVCDGMGGAAGGSVAGSVACEVFVSCVEKTAKPIFKKGSLTHADEKRMKNVLINAVEMANKAVFEKALSVDGLRGMGTTLVATVAVGSTLFTVNVGDSRMYHVTNNYIKQVTRDHSYVQFLVDCGKMSPEEAKKSINRNIITRAVGTDKTVESDFFITYTDPSEKNTVLLCSDGLVNCVTPDRIYEVLSLRGMHETEDSLSLCLDMLIDEANVNGGSDNITAVLMSI